MKYLHYLVPGLFAILLSFSVITSTGCKDDNPVKSNDTTKKDTTDTTKTGGTKEPRSWITVDINGIEWKSDTAFYEVDIFNSSKRNVEGTKGDQWFGETVILRLVDTVPGTFPLSNYIGDYGVTYMKSLVPSQATEGEITITTSTAELIEGTFHFKSVTATGPAVTYNGTDGKFKVYK